MKAKITYADGRTVELEGTADEIVKVGGIAERTFQTATKARLVRDAEDQKIRDRLDKVVQALEGQAVPQAPFAVWSTWS